MRGELEAIEAEQGERPTTCPWRAYADSDVVAVIQAYDFWESGQCAEWWGADPEWWLVEAVRYYHRALGTARDAVHKLRRDKNTAVLPARPPIGQVVDRIRG